MKILLRSGLIIAIVAALIFIKNKYFPIASQAPVQASNSASAKAPQSVGVNGYIAGVEKLDNKIFATGSIIASEMVDIKPELAGKIVHISFTEGKFVKKGQPLIKLNDADYQATLRKLEAQLKIAQQSRARLAKLLEIKGVSQDEYDAVENQVNNIKADIEFQKVQIDKTEILAPFNGVIGLKSVSVGSFIGATSMVVSIQALNPIKIDFTIPEKYAYQVKMGEVLKFNVDGIKDDFMARVYAAENQIDPVSRSLKIRATADNSKNLLKPGAFVRVNFNLNVIDNALMIPTEAIVAILKGQQVYTVKNGKAVATPIDIGIRTDTKVQVTNGLAVGDTVLTSGLMGIKPGASVKVSVVR